MLPVNVAKSIITSGFSLRCQSQCIRQNHSSFGIGMDNLDRRAIQRRDDIILLIGMWADEILRNGKPAIDIYRQVGASRGQQ